MKQQATTRPRLAAFGSSRTGSHEPVYRDVSALSRSIAEAGWNGMTGGHQGMMAAFSEGIHAGGGHVRGITLERFPTPPDNHLSEEVRAHNFFDRMQVLIEQTDAYLILPGGLGTLAELAMSWDLQAIGVLEKRPLIVYGDSWTPLLQPLRESLIWSVDEAFALLRHCRNADEVLAALA